MPKADADHGLINRTFRSLNFKYGDPAITGQIHPLRLAGCQNRKPKHARCGRYPIVTVAETSPGIICEQTRKFIRDLPPALPKRRSKLPKACPAMASPDLVQIAQEEYEILRERYGVSMDMAKADFMIARGLLSLTDISVAEAASVVLVASPGIMGREESPGRYAARTARAALESIRP